MSVVTFNPSPNGARQADAGLDSLWTSYRRSGDPAARTELLERHLYLVRILARKLAARTGGAVEVDDLIGAGTLGLVQALDSFDPSRANSFATYASRRVHGAMLDELRDRDWVPRSVRSKARKLDRVAGRISAAFGRAPAPAEMAAALELDLSTYWAWRASVDGACQVSLEDAPALLHSRMAPLGLDHDHAGPDSVEMEERVGLLAAGLARLPERERTVLALYFYEELNLREIAAILRLTESRISQIRTAALRRLRGLLLPLVA